LLETWRALGVCSNNFADCASLLAGDGFVGQNAEGKQLACAEESLIGLLLMID
jgi:hypothetical protein